MRYIKRSWSAIGSQTMKKRTESSLVSACLKYLQCLENIGHIIWCDRLNSGSAQQGKYRFRLCREGTPDMFCILNDFKGTVVWIEAKTDSGELTEGQKAWETRVESLDCHVYLVVKDIDKLKEHLKFLGVKE